MRIETIVALVAIGLALLSLYLNLRKKGPSKGGAVTPKPKEEAEVGVDEPIEDPTKEPLPELPIVPDQIDGKKPVIDLKLTWPGEYDANGWKKLRLELRNNGKVVDAKSVYSGTRGRQKENFILPRHDTPGSGRPLPEGIYDIGAISRGGKNAPGVGDIWIPVDVFDSYKANHRSAFGFHDDANRSTARGSLGCIVFYSRSDLLYVMRWLEAEASPAHLVVDWKLGFLEERGYVDPTTGQTKPILGKPDKKPTRISDKGLELVKGFEGLRLSAYDDGTGTWTIGWGHTKSVYRGQKITEADAIRLLKEDMNVYETAVRRAVKVPVQQHQFDACVSLCFNIGIAGFNRSSVLVNLNARKYAESADSFKLWNKATINGQLKVLDGLTRRRKAEAHLFRTGDVQFFA